MIRKCAMQFCKLFRKMFQNHSYGCWRGCNSFRILEREIKFVSLISRSSSTYMLKFKKSTHMFHMSAMQFYNFSRNLKCIYDCLPVNKFYYRLLESWISFSFKITIKIYISFSTYTIHKCAMRFYKLFRNPIHLHIRDRLQVNSFYYKLKVE